MEAGRAPPVDVLAAVVGQHLFGDAVFCYCPAVCFKHVRRRLAPVKPQAGYIARVVVDKADQVGVRAGQPERADIRLPQLVRFRSFEESGFGRIAGGFYPFLLDQLFFDKRFLYGSWTGLDKEEPFQGICYSAGTVGWILLFKIDDLLFYGLIDARGLTWGKR